MFEASSTSLPVNGTSQAARSPLSKARSPKLIPTSRSFRTAAFPLRCTKCPLSPPKSKRFSTRLRLQVSTALPLHILCASSKPFLNCVQAYLLCGRLPSTFCAPILAAVCRWLDPPTPFCMFLQLSFLRPLQMCQCAFTGQRRHPPPLPWSGSTVVAGC
jgi:hypothetical protein